MDIQPGEKVQPKLVDVCILMDITGSMNSYIRNARDSVLDAFDALRSMYPNCEFRLSFIGYRDYEDEEQFIVIPFTFDIESVRNKISIIRALGGNDVPEDVAGAFKKTSELDWQGDVKTIFFVTDAPAHGTDYHPITLGDRYPRGDPTGLDPKQQATEFAHQGIDLTLFRVTPQVDMMIEQFYDAYKHSLAIGLFTVLDVEKQLNPYQHSSDDDMEMDRCISSFDMGVKHDYSDSSDIFKKGLIASTSSSLDRCK